MTRTAKQTTTIEPLMEQLLRTISREHTLLEELEQRLAAKLDAIRLHSAERLAETTHDISQTNQEIDALAAQRLEQMESLGRMLGSEEPVNSLDDLHSLCQQQSASDTADDIARWQVKMRRQARRTQERCEEVTFALQYATRLGQEMLQALRGQIPEPGSSGSDGYTSTGTAASSANSSSLVNHVG